MRARDCAATVPTLTAWLHFSLLLQALDQIPCASRVLLSGTPMQNDLNEFFAMVQFTNPGVLGTAAQFRKHYERPILRGREPDASDKETSIAIERSGQLSSIVRAHVARARSPFPVRSLTAHAL